MTCGYASRLVFGGDADGRGGRVHTAQVRGYHGSLSQPVQSGTESGPILGRAPMEQLDLVLDITLIIAVVVLIRASVVLYRQARELSRASERLAHQVRDGNLRILYAVNGEKYVGGEIDVHADEVTPGGGFRCCPSATTRPVS
jgi:hypothetical protein